MVVPPYHNHGDEEMAMPPRTSKKVMNDFGYDVCITLQYPNGVGIDLDTDGEIGSIRDLRVEDIAAYLEYATNLWYDAVAKEKSWREDFHPVKPNDMFGVRWRPVKPTGDGVIQAWAGSYYSGAPSHVSIGTVEIGMLEGDDE